MQYGEEKQNAAFGAEFMQSMTYFSKHCLQGGDLNLKDAFPWGNSKCIMDVGGGRGELLSSAVSWGSDTCKGVLFDRPFVIEG